MLGALSRAAHAQSAVLPPDGEYVTVQNGHLSQNGRRVRFWGAIGGFPGKNARDANAVITRLGDLGFNMVRLWGHHRLKEDYARGDGSQSDVYDGFITQMKRRGMRVWLPSITAGTAQAADVNVINDPATAGEWTAAMNEIGEKGLSLPDSPAVIWDPRLRALALRQIRRVGNHVNQHTGLRLADDPTIAIWELTNEQWWFGEMVSGRKTKDLPAFFQRELLAQWNGFLQDKYGSEAKLKAAWAELLPGESLQKGSILLLPLRSNADAGAQTKALGVDIGEGVTPRTNADDFKTQRGRDVIEFLLKIWIEAKREQHNLVKSLGKSMKLSPLVWDTGIGYEIQAQWMQQHADAIAHDTYITGFMHDPTHWRFPWYSGLEEEPRLFWDVPWLEHNRHPDKPYLVYETQIEQPAKYRAEYPYRIAALGAIQDWDAVCWHYFGPVPDADKPNPYEKALDYTQAKAGAHPQGYHYQYDEVQMSAMKAAAEVFKGFGAQLMVGDDSLVGPACSAWQQMAIGLGAVWCEALEKPDESSQFFHCVRAQSTAQNPDGRFGLSDLRPGFGLDVDADTLRRNCAAVHQF